MIESFHVQNYKALRDVRLELTPVHVLIGPNDSGKTSILEALTALSRMTRVEHLAQAFPGWWQGRELVWCGDPEGKVSFHTVVQENGLQEHEIVCQFAAQGRGVTALTESATVTLDGRRVPIDLRSGMQGAQRSVFSRIPEDVRLKHLYGALSRNQSYRWIPSHLALPVAYGFSTAFGMEPSGFGLAQYLNDILTYDYRRFGDLEERFQVYFPATCRIRLRRESGFSTILEQEPRSPGLGIYFEQDGGFLLPASQASDGMLLVLAYLAILHSPEPPRLLLIEEPENGVHPRRLREVIQILKELVGDQDRTQVLLTTHSPYVVDLFEPREVTLCLKDKDGAVTTHRLSESKSVREQIDIFQLGEIWTAEGDEALAAPAESEAKSAT
jgi:predicted ATPase